MVEIFTTTVSVVFGVIFGIFTALITLAIAIPVLVLGLIGGILLVAVIIDYFEKGWKKNDKLDGTKQD